LKKIQVEPNSRVVVFEAVVVVGEAGGLVTSSEVGWALVPVVGFLVVGGSTLVVVAGPEVGDVAVLTVVFSFVVDSSGRAVLTQTKIGKNKVN